MDLVYIYNSRKKDHNPIKYSIRSAEENFKFDRLWIIGGKPEFIECDFIPYEDRREVNRMINVEGKLKKLTESRVSEDFVLMNDDFFFLEPVEEIEYRHLGSFREWYNNKTDAFHSKKWRLLIENTYREYPDWNFYEAHYPIIYNKKKLKKVLKKIPQFNLPIIRSYYGNLNKVNGREVEDYKLRYIDDLEKYWNNEFLSTDDRVEKSQRFLKFIEGRFPNPSKYETRSYN